MSNTPVVAMFIPFLRDWANRHKLSLYQKILIPLSFASILGGVCTLIGTSTNIIVVGLLQSSPELASLNLFSPAVVGIPIIIFGIIYFALIGHKLLPDRRIESGDFDIVRSSSICCQYENRNRVASCQEKQLWSLGF